MSFCFFVIEPRVSQTGFNFAFKVKDDLSARIIGVHHHPWLPSLHSFWGLGDGPVGKGHVKQALSVDP